MTTKGTPNPNINDISSKSRENESSSSSSSTTRSILWRLFRLTVVSLVLEVAVALKKYVNHGSFTPWTCSVFGYQCSRLYDVPFNGYVHKDYITAQEVFKQNFYSGEEVGAATAAYVDGELVLDIQGGWQDPDKNIPYTDKTLQMVFSSTKALTSIVVAQFVEKGVLSYDEKISTYWPEFSQGNKENVTLGDLMQHAAGVGYLENGITTAELEDPERRSHILAEQPHNFGGRVAGRTVNDVAADLNEKYGIEWYLRPYQEEYDYRISSFYTAPTIIRIYSTIKELGGIGNFFKAILNPDENVMKSVASLPDGVATSAFPSLRLRRVESPSYSGHTNARSIAKLAAMMANKGKAIVDGEPDLLSTETYNLVTEPVPLDFDVFFKRHINCVKGGWGNHEDFSVEGVQFIGWPGFGGSTFFWNHELKIGFGYHMNGIASGTIQSPDNRSMSILGAIVKEALKKKNNTSR
ncbi:beta-lactamase/transpeptidase-like protein [Phascolomyces articulosus]|uniref:Beta-lactamase/transpeptidase-like protein n=1 Tax=Phascolomyces articulosus TaxID=60185 RepID=A0AAD5PAQ9_9FUNG|nr:beta-lactamase/transpeptidase-like protein [Phascolomyces articulosus]